MPYYNTQSLFPALFGAIAYSHTNLGSPYFSFPRIFRGKRVSVAVIGVDYPCFQSRLRVYNIYATTLSTEFKAPISSEPAGDIMGEGDTVSCNPVRDDATGTLPSRAGIGMGVEENDVEELVLRLPYLHSVERGMEEEESHRYRL